ncbi:MAG: hypothetical protein IPI41_05400 [Flavobacteriales bacterium]|nr:hypothetical protein [Flavobacteriales bacterium]
MMPSNIRNIGPVLFAIMVACWACGPSKEIIGMVRGANGEKPLQDVKAELWDSAAFATGVPIHTCTTNGLGLFGFQDTDKLIGRAREHPDRGTSWIQVIGARETRVIPITGYRGLYDIRLADGEEALPDTAFKVADMHYHVSMRIHNHFGLEVHEDSRNGELDTIPKDLSWYRDQSKLRVWGSGKWKKAPPMKWSKIEKAVHGNGKKLQAYRALLTKGMVRAKKGNNTFKHHNQATHPHIRNGHVRLAYNAISPFENSLNTGFFTRFFGGSIKTGLKWDWSDRIGGKVNRPQAITHWEDFLYEHGMMREQDRSIEGLDWRFLKDGCDLEQDNRSSFVVTAVEGGHFLQDDLFPNGGGGTQERDIAGRSSRAQDRIISTWRSLLKGDRLSDAQKEDVQETLSCERTRDEVRDTGDEAALQQAERELYGAVDNALIHELERNIAHIRDTAFFPPVHMVAIAHLGYNGMTGHAPALDDGGGLVNMLAGKIYNMRLSNDPSYIKQWSRLYFSVPGVNKYGVTMIKGLSEPVHGRRILIDLKHSDLMTRHYFYDSIMPSGLPPICSHCGVTGMSERYWSPFNNEYNLLKDPLVRTYYPFGINLYDEEILLIHEKNGIIGLPMEERLLGGYIKRRMPWNMFISATGKYKLERTGDKTRRWKHSRRLFRWLWKSEAHERQWGIDGEEITEAKRLLRQAMDSSKMAAPGASGTQLLKIATKDFISVAPFIQNLFYILDKILGDGPIPPGEQGVLTLRRAWSRVCIGSDMDGLIDPIDLLPTAGEYPLLRDRLEQYIPLFLYFRKWERPPLIDRPADEPFRALEDYCPDGFPLDSALNGLFYENLKDFTIRNTQATPSPCE